MRKSDEGYYKNAGIEHKPAMPLTAKAYGLTGAMPRTTPDTAHQPQAPLTPQSYGGSKAMPMIPMAAEPKSPNATVVPPPFKRKGF